MAVTAPRDSGRELDGTWALPNGSLASTRAAARATITSRTVATLEPAWRFRFRGKGGGFGSLTSTPLVVGGTVYVQDAKSSVFALERRSGRLRWARLYAAPNDGPNGVAVVGGRVVAATDTTAFALDRANGRRCGADAWPTGTSSSSTSRPSSIGGRVYVSTVGFPPGGRGAVYALDARHGSRPLEVRDDRRAVADRDRPAAAERGTPCRSTAQGRVYAGIANPGPGAGRGASRTAAPFAGPRALHRLARRARRRDRRGSLWYDQVTPHDVRDYDFQSRRSWRRAGGRELVFGAGKGGA